MQNWVFPAVLVALVFSSSVQAAFDQLYRPMAVSIPEKAYEYEITGSVFQTTALFDSEGTEFALNEGESFSVLQSDLTLRYGYGPQLEFNGGLRFRQVSASYTSGSDEISTSNSGVESYFIGFKYSLKSSSRLRYSFDLQLRQAAYENTDYTSLSQVPEDEVILGDSGSSYSLGLSLSYQRTKDHYLNAFAAFRQPGNNLSGEVPYDINTVWTWSQWALGIGLEGIYSLKSDEYSSNPDLKPPQGRAPSNLYNSINRQWAAPKASVYYAFGNWRLGFEAATRMQGISTDKGQVFTLSLLKRSGKARTAEVKKKTAFKEYRIEGTVLKVSPRGRFVQIDQGISQDVEKDMQFDIYQTDFFGGNELVATAIAYEVGLQKSILKIVKVYSSKRVEKGFVARAQ